MMFNKETKTQVEDTHEAKRNTTTPNHLLVIKINKINTNFTNSSKPMVSRPEKELRVFEFGIIRKSSIS